MMILYERFGRVTVVNCDTNLKIHVNFFWVFKIKNKNIKILTDCMVDANVAAFDRVLGVFCSRDVLSGVFDPLVNGDGDEAIFNGAGDGL